MSAPEEPSVVMVLRGEDEWRRMWSYFPDPGEEDPVTGERWQYMGTFREGNGTYTHEFRHRCHPESQRREIRQIPAARGWRPLPLPSVSVEHAHEEDFEEVEGYLRLVLHSFRNISPNEPRPVLLEVSEALQDRCTITAGVAGQSLTFQVIYEPELLSSAEDFLQSLPEHLREWVSVTRVDLGRFVVKDVLKD